MTSTTPFATAVKIWNDDLPETPIQQVNFPQFKPLSSSRVPPSEEAAQFLETNTDPRSLWANHERNNVSEELQQTNKTDLTKLTESILNDSISSLSVSASSSRKSTDESEMKLNRRFVPSKEINQRVQLSNAFWLSHRDVSAVTVSANEALQGGGGQDKVLHFLAGPSLKAETATFPDDGREYYGGLRVRCPTGQVRISHGHNLHQPFIIHLVGPYLDEHEQVQTNLYIQTMRNVLACIDGNRIRSISLAVFGTGYYGCPHLLATIMTLRVVREWLESPENRGKCDRIVICPPHGGEVVFEMLWSIAFPTSVLQ